MKEASKRVAVIGLGYVGFPLAALAAKKGYEVTAVDISAEKVAAVNKGESPLEDEPAAAPEVMARLHATTDFSVIKDIDTVIVCVPTPVHENHEPDLGPLSSAIAAIGAHIRPGHLVISESTVNPGVSDDVLLPLLEQASGLKCGTDFHLSHCPERINPGDPKWKVHNIPRVVGSYDKVGLKRSVEFYKSILEGEIVPMDSLKEAEAVKIIENCFRDVNIAFVNELAMSFDKLGINVKKIIQGASTKPFAFMPHFPGCGVGGHCIPVDPYYLIEYARTQDFEHEFLATARRINNQMPDYTITRLMDGLNEAGLALKGTKVALLGVSYKSNIADYRESPSFKLIELLKEKGADVTVYDPYVLSKSTVKTLKEALTSAEAVLLATNHDEFLAVTPEELVDYGVKVYVDGRNACEPQPFKEAGIVYRGIGVS